MVLISLFLLFFRLSNAPPSVPRPPNEDLIQVTQSINLISLTLIEDYEKMFQVLTTIPRLSTLTNSDGNNPRMWTTIHTTYEL